MARYNKRYKYYYRNEPNILDMLFEIIVAFIFFVGKLFLKLLQKIFSHRHNVSKGSYRISNQFTDDTAVSRNYPIYHDDINEGAQEKTTDGVCKKYDLRPSLLTQAEKNFLEVLKKIVDDVYIIENQVQLSRIVSPADSGPNFVNYKDFNQIKAKSIDFVLYDKDYKPYLCIELDDMSHLRWDRQKRDVFVNKIMEDVGLRIIHIQASYNYNLEQLRQQIFG
jgi:hypothetical protein